MEPSKKSQFYPFIEKIPNVLECSCVTGEFSMHMKTCFHTTMELDNFVTELRKFGPTSTQIVFSSSVEPRGIMF